MTGAELAKQVGLSTQQLSKIERNRNRINAGQLWLFSQCLGQSVDWFFENPGQSAPEVRSVRKVREFFTIVTALEPSQIRLIANATKMLVAGKAEELIHPAYGAQDRPNAKMPEELEISNSGYFLSRQATAAS